VNETLRRRKAAHLLRQRAADALEEASRLDGWPILHLTVADESRIADALGISVERLHQAVETLMPADDTNEGNNESMSNQNDDDVQGIPIYDQPPGWAVQEARDQLGDEAAWEDVARLAWEYVKRDEPDEEKED
jgi:hypothetical protein